MWAANTAEIAARQASLADNFIKGIEPYIGGEHPEISLRPHQVPTLGDLQDLMAETRDTPGRRILWPSPPNFGKSTMSALTVREAGIGRTPAGSARPLKALLFVPRDIARQQVIASCKHFAPSVKVRGFKPCKGKQALDHADALVLTYKGLTGLAGDDWRYIAERTDLWIFDEVHRALGPETSQRLLNGMDTFRPTVLALSATPDFSEDRTAADILRINYFMKGMTPRQAIESGASNGVWLLALKSDTTLHFSSHRNTITEQDTLSLIDDEARNELIVAVKRDMGNLGLRGLTKCASGRNNRHAELIAEMASEQKIIDPKTGEERKLRVEAVGVQKKGGNAAIVARFRAGEIDALTFSKYLIEAYDDDVRYVFAAVPMSSAVDMGQLVGRGGRLGDPRITRLFCIIDKYSSVVGKTLQTPFHVFGQEGFYQGEMISAQQNTPRQSDQDQGSDKQPRQRHPSSHNKRTDMYQGLSAEVRAAFDRIPHGTIIDDLVIVKESLQEVPEGYVPLMDLAIIKNGNVLFKNARFALQGLVDSGGLPAWVNVTTDVRRTYVSPAAAKMLEERYKSRAAITRQEIQNFLYDQGWPRISFDGFAACCARANAKFTTYKNNICLTPDNTATLLCSMAEVPLLDPRTEVLVTDLVEPLDFRGSKEIIRLLDGRPDQYGPHRLARRRGRQPGAYQVVNALTTEGALMLAAYTTTMKKRRTGDPEAVVAEAQQRHLQYAWNQKLHPKIERQAIVEFIRSLGHAAFTMTQDQAIEDQAIGGPADLRWLDESFSLSQHGHEWYSHANCKDKDPDLFSKEDEASVRQALAICKSCGVKGDCLRRSLQLPVEGTAGGLRPDERKRLKPVKAKVLSWLEQTKKAPNTRQKN